MLFDLEEERKRCGRVGLELAVMTTTGREICACEMPMQGIMVAVDAEAFVPTWVVDHEVLVVAVAWTEA